MSESEDSASDPIDKKDSPETGGPSGKLAAYEELRRTGMWKDGIMLTRPGAETDRYLLYKSQGVELMYSGTKVKKWKYDTSDDGIYEQAIRKLWLITGKRGTGKTVFITDWLYNFRKIYGWGVICTHTKQNGHFQQFWPNDLITEQWNEPAMRELFEYGIARKNTPGINSLFLVVMDDIIADPSLRWYQSVKKISTEGRHSNFSCLATSQHFKSIPNHFRDNTDFFVIMATTNREVLNSMYDEMGAFFVNRDHFFAFVELNTRDDWVLIVENNKYLRGSDRWYRYKAPNATLGWEKRFHMLCPEAWGNERGRRLRQQRKFWKEPIDYTILTLLRMKNKSQMEKASAEKVLARRGEQYSERPMKFVKNY